MVSLDIGSSSVRALLFDAEAKQMEGYGASLPVKIRTTPDGGAELHPDELTNMVLDCLDEVHRQTHASGLTIAAVTGCAFMHGIVGADDKFQATTPVFHLFDSRAGKHAALLPDASARTGCPPHGSYWPAKVLWLAETRPRHFAVTRHWMSFPEFLYARIFGRPRTSVSLSSATGFWNQAAGDWDTDLMARAGVRREQFARKADLGVAEHELPMEHRQSWPTFARAVWFPLIADGAAAHIGSGCYNSNLFSLTVGTTGAIRMATPTPPPQIAKGLWRYSTDAKAADTKQALIGGAISNGGEVLAWAKRTLQLPRDIEARLDSAFPGTHGLGVLPFFAGERTPYWRDDFRGALTGLTFATEPFDILHAALEGVTLGFREVHQLMTRTLGTPAEIIASGGALLRSTAWTQMIADAVGGPVTISTELEASCRGAAMVALAETSVVPSLSQIVSSTGATYDPRAEQHEAFLTLSAKRAQLLEQLYGIKPSGTNA